MRYAIYVLLTLLTINTAHAQAFVGRWYFGDAKACKGEKGGTQGLLVYTAKEFFGYESICRIIGSTPKGTGFELTLRCRAEGETTTDREVVEVQDRRLKRTTNDSGKKETFTYSRCP
jgi:hypothetical protein